MLPSGVCKTSVVKQKGGRRVVRFIHSAPMGPGTAGGGSLDGIEKISGVRIPRGPPKFGLACSVGARLPCKQFVEGSTPFGSTKFYGDYGVVVRTSLCESEGAGFNSR